MFLVFTVGHGPGGFELKLCVIVKAQELDKARKAPSLEDSINGGVTIYTHIKKDEHLRSEKKNALFTHGEETTNGGGGGELLLGVVAHEVGDGLLDLGGDRVLGGDVERGVVVRVVVKVIGGGSKDVFHVTTLVDDTIVLLFADSKVLGLTLLAEGIRVKDLVVLSHFLCVFVCVCVCKVEKMCMKS